MDLSVFKAVLVATQHDVSIRALIVAAQRAHVPVVYLPHAPVANNGQYSDLPVMYAALRGRREVEHYAASFGVVPETLDVVGNPASDLLAQGMPSLERDAAGVLALSPHRKEVVARLFRLVAESGIEHVIVAPHPRSDRSMIASLVPTGWSVYEGGRTLDLLRGGPSFVIQYSSGVAWESAALGIPTATIRLDEEGVNYPFLEDQSIFPHLRTSSEIKEFVDSARRGLIDRDRLRSAALEWCGVDGREAAQRVRDLLSGIASRTAHDRPKRILDGWRDPDGPSFQASWVTSVQGLRSNGSNSNSAPRSTQE